MKVSSLSKLKNLPAEKQRMIFERLTVRTDDWPDTSLTAVRDWLATTGVKTSTAALSEFHSWFALKRQLEKNQTAVQTLLAEAEKEHPNWTPEELRELGQAFFQALALDQRDPKVWMMTQKLARDFENLKLARKKFDLLIAERERERAERDAAEKQNAQAMTQAERIAAMRKESLREVEALRASGRLKIPTP